MLLEDLSSIEIFSVDEWRSWLEANHRSEHSVWVVCHTKKSVKPSVGWSQMVDEALCFGWIDSTRKTIDEHRYRQLFSQRKPDSTWSMINKEKIENLIAEGRMTIAGMEAVERARNNGSWTILDEVEQLMIPEDLMQAFTLSPAAMQFYDTLSKSLKKVVLQRIAMAKRPETRQKRIIEATQSLALNKKPVV